eukprot:m.22406 g.22406  ORF g.22406 m.22406 type:complete len:447 (+) comp7397_c0_seq2:254-1594(+)
MEEENEGLFTGFSNEGVVAGQPDAPETNQPLQDDPVSLEEAQNIDNQNNGNIPVERIRVPLYIVIAATAIKHLLFACAGMAAISLTLYFTASVLPDMIRYSDNAEERKFAKLGIYRVCDVNGNCGSYSSTICNEISQGTGGSFCNVRFPAAIFLLVGCFANLMILFSIASLFSSKRWACCPTRMVGPSLFIGIILSIISGIITMSLCSNVVQEFNMNSDSGGLMTHGPSFSMVATAWPLSVVNLVTAFCTAILIFLLGQVYNHLHQRQMLEQASHEQASQGHRLPLEPYVLKMICRSDGVWGSEFIDPISLDKFAFGAGVMVLPCGHVMQKASVDAMFAGSSESDLKPCPMCRVPATRKAFAVISDKDAPKTSTVDDSIESESLHSFQEKAVESLLANPPPPPGIGNNNNNNSNNNNSNSSRAPALGMFDGSGLLERTGLLDGIWL